MNRFNPGDKARVKIVDWFGRYNVVTIDGDLLYRTSTKSEAEVWINKHDEYILEPIEPVQEEESTGTIESLRKEVKQLNVYLDEATEGYREQQATISRLKSEIEELKRKA